MRSKSLGGGCTGRSGNRLKNKKVTWDHGASMNYSWNILEIHTSVRKFSNYIKCLVDNAIFWQYTRNLIGHLWGFVTHKKRSNLTQPHDDVIEWKHFPRYLPFVRGIHRSPANSPHKGQWRGVLMFSLICAWINGWVNNGEVGDLRRHRAHYNVTVMVKSTARNISWWKLNSREIYSLTTFRLLHFYVK